MPWEEHLHTPHQAALSRCPHDSLWCWDAGGVTRSRQIIPGLICLPRRDQQFKVRRSSLSGIAEAHVKYEREVIRYQDMTLNKQKPPKILHIEPRWPVALMILLVMGLITALPDRVSLFPDWVPATLGIAVLVPMIAVSLTGATRWLRMERIIMLLFFGVAGGGNLVSLSYLINEMLNQSKALNGLQLLTSSIAVWMTNVLTFSLLYWQIDRGGPEARMNKGNIRPDWLFPKVDLPDGVMPDWRSTFVDYLFLAYTTATAFSPTDAPPLTIRAKLLMMLESTISLATILVVVSRAINILGS